MNPIQKIFLVLLCVSLLPITTPVELTAQPPQVEESPDELAQQEADWAKQQADWAQQQADSAKRQRSDIQAQEEKWLAEQDRRREQEGPDFDEQAYVIEEALMKRRSELEESRIRQEEQTYQAYRDLDAQQLTGDAYNTEREALERLDQERRGALETKFQELEQEQQTYWAKQQADWAQQEADWAQQQADWAQQQADSAKRQRSELEAQEGEWLAEQKLRREQEGDDFDEQLHLDGSDLMARWRVLVESRILQEEQTYQAYRDLDARQLTGDAYNTEREALERSEQERRGALEAKFHALDQDHQAYLTMRQARDQEMEEKRQAALLEPDSPGVSLEIKRLHPCNIAAAAAAAEAAEAAAKAAGNYVCCTPGIGGLQCETVNMYDKSREQCDQQAQKVNAQLDETNQVFLWTDTDRGDRCQDRFKMANRGNSERDASFAGCGGAVSIKHVHKSPVMHTTITLWTDTDRLDRCQDRLSIADRGGPAQDCSWASCAGLCETPEAAVCCTPDRTGVNCQVIGGPTDWSAY